MILGIDEVGRGSWAGPLVVGAVVLGGEVIECLTDSKKLTANKRDLLDKEIRAKASGFGLGWIEPSEIDSIGLSEALKKATKLAVEQVKTPYSQIIIDGTVNFLSGTTKEKYVSLIKKADLLIPSVSAASIIAKVARDKYMKSLDDDLPEYSFSSHVGYGTAAHMRVLEKLGPTIHHRLSFRPLKNMQNISYGGLLNHKKAMSTKEIGGLAEEKAAEYLEKIGHTILHRNWKTKLCEIDIVSLYKDSIYFNEVKYRINYSHGGGMSAITNAKLKQMKFAAQYYSTANQLDDSLGLRLAAVSVNGNPPVVNDYLEII